MMSIQALRERKAALAKDLNDLVTKTDGKAWTAEHQAKYDAGLAEIESIEDQVKRIEAVMALAADQKIEDEILEKTERIAHDKKSAAAVAFAQWIRSGKVSPEIKATLSTGVGYEGGYAVQTDVARTIADALKAFSNMRAVATVIQTEMGNPINYPTSDGTAEEGEILGENTAAAAADPTIGVITLNTYKYSSKIIAAPIELLQDANVDIEGFVIQRSAQRLARIQETHFTTGTGTGQPRGVVTAAGVGKTGTTGQTTTVTFDDLIDLVHSVDPAYRGLGRCRFMMHDTSLAKIRKLKDSQNRPIFLPGYDGIAGPMPDRLLGYEVVINQNVAQMAANAKSILFGDFSYYVIRDVMAAEMYRFTDSAYMTKGQVGFLMLTRSGGNFIDVGGAVKYYQNSAT